MMKEDAQSPPANVAGLCTQRVGCCRATYHTNLPIFRLKIRKTRRTKDSIALLPAGYIPGDGILGFPGDGLEPAECREDGLVLLLQEQGVVRGEEGRKEEREEGRKEEWGGGREGGTRHEENRS